MTIPPLPRPEGRVRPPGFFDDLSDLMDENALRFFLEAGVELQSAQAKHPDEEGRLTDAEWLAVLTEEVGECARAIQDETDERLRAELLQVAAMACRWALSIPLGRKRPPWAGQ